MTTNHTELCERLRDQASFDQKQWGGRGGDYVSISTEAADMLEQQAARIQQQALEYVSLFDQCSQHLARIAELEKERDALRADAERYEYLLDCEVEAARRYLPSLDADEFKNARRARHSAAIRAEKETRS